MTLQCAAGGRDSHEGCLYRNGIKRVLDVLLASTMLLLLSPLFLALMLWIGLDTKGGVFFRQKRVGSRQLRRVRPAQKDAQSGGFLFQTGTQAADAALIAHFPGEPPQGQGAALGGAQFAGHSVVRVRPQPFQQSGP